MDSIFMAMLWTITFCSDGSPAEVKCSDGTLPHKLEMRLLEGKGGEVDPARVDKVFVLLRDEKEVASLPASLLSLEEIQRLIEVAWPHDRHR